jgi:PAS domain-containing protein
MPCGIVVLNHRGEIVSINDAARRLLALSAEAARGRFLARALRHPLLHADGSPLSVEEYPGIRAVRTRQPVPAMTVSLGDGAEHHWLCVEATPLLGPGGRIGAVVMLSGAVEPQAKADEGFHPRRESAA